MQQLVLLTLFLVPAHGFMVQPLQRGVHAVVGAGPLGQIREPLPRYSPLDEDGDDEEESACQLSLQHRSTLRKESEHRRKRKELATAFVARGSTEGTMDSETGEVVAWGTESLEAISNMLDEHEIVEVRGVALDHVKQSPEACRRLVMALRAFDQAREMEEATEDEEEEALEEGKKGDDDVDFVEYDGLAMSMLQVQLLQRKVSDEMEIRYFVM